MMKTREDAFGSFAAMVVRDAEVMLDFYQNVLGMKMAFTDDADEGVTKHYLTFTNGMLKMFVPDNPPEKRASDDMMATTGYGLQTYMVTNMTELFESLEKNGVRIVSAPQSTPDGSKWGIIMDPEGNLIEMAGTG